VSEPRQSTCAIRTVPSARRKRGRCILSWRAAPASATVIRTLTAHPAPPSGVARTPALRLCSAEAVHPRAVRAASFRAAMRLVVGACRILRPAMPSHLLSKSKMSPFPSPFPSPTLCRSADRRSRRCSARKDRRRPWISEVSIAVRCSRSMHVHDVHRGQQT
jgi:hypothetical protein